MAVSYRSVTEVLKWTTPVETLSELALVNKCFLRASDSDELWHSYIELKGFNLEQLTQKPVQIRDGFHSLNRLMRKQIVSCSSNHLTVFNCETGTSIKKCINPDLSISNSSALVLIRPTELFICGGHTNPQTVSVYDLDLGTVIQLSSMFCPRLFHAVMYRNGQVYAFGGEASGNTAEKYDIAAQAWTQLPNMIHARSFFTVCAQGKLIYICGGFNVHCETFNCTTEVFRLLSYELGEMSDTISFIYDNELLVVCYGKCYYVNREDHTVKTGRCGLIP